MNFAPPSWIREAAEQALESVATNHYSHPKGRLRLREAIKQHYEADFGRSLDVEKDILVTSGANEGYSSLCKSLFRAQQCCPIQANTLFSWHFWSMETRSSSSNPSSISTSPPSLSMEASRSTSPFTRRRPGSTNRLDATGKLTSTNYGSFPDGDGGL